MACFKLTYNKTPELKIVHAKKELTLKNSSEKACKHYPFGMSIGDLAVDRGADNKLKYNGKELQDDLLGGISLALYDYGARFKDGPRWTTIDPLAEKYYSISPYAYVANNPIIFIDPDGRKIVIGNLVDRALNKVGIKTEYVQKVEHQLAELKLLDNDVSNMIDGLIESPRTHKIVNTEKSTDGNSITINTKKAKKGEKQGTTINYNPENNKRADGEVRDSKVGLTHELQHSSDADNGTLNFNKTKSGIKLLEVKAVKTENKVRKKLGIHRRTTYGKKEIPRGMLREDYKIK